MNYPPYPEYKDSGIEWLGEIPDHWSAVALQHLFRIVGGSTPKSDVARFWDGDIIWVTPADLGASSSLFVSSSRRTITDAGINSCSAEVLPENTVIISVRAPIGTVGIARRPMATNQGCKGLVGDAAITSFVAYQLSSQQSTLNAIGRGTTFTELSATDLGAFRVALPPPSEQQLIADFLDRETAKIDALIAKQEQLIATLREDRIATITHAVTKGLDPNAEMKDSGVEWLGEIPAHWACPQIGMLSSVGNGSTPARENPAYWSNGSIPWLNSSHVNRDEITEADQFVSELAVKECHLPMVEPGSVLVGLTGQGKTRGMSSLLLFRCTINQHLAYVTPRYDAVSAPYLRRVLDSAYDTLRDISDENGSTKGGLTCTAIRKLRIPLPPLHEQREITSYVSQRTAKLDALIAKSEQMIGVLREYRSALITDAVTGKIDVRGAA